jgi:hypothetical protein
MKYLLAIMLLFSQIGLSACSQRDEASRHQEAWESYEYQKKEADAPNKKQNTPQTDFGACNANDLINFSCD